MKLTALETVGVRNLPDRTFDMVDPEGEVPPLVVVTGPPGAGATSFLDAVAYSAARMSTGGVNATAEDVLRPGGSAATIRTTWWLDADERAFGGLIEETTQAEVSFRRGALGTADADPGLLGLMSRYDHRPDTSKVVSFPARRVTDEAFSPIGDFEAEQRYMHLAPGAEKFAGLPRAVVKHALGAGDRSRFEEVQQVFAALAAQAQLVGVASNGQPEFAVGGGARTPLGRLSFSQRNAFVLAAATVLMGLSTSVILLDTPEMGLPVGLAARWIDVLREHAPRAQWLVATRDPELVGRPPPSARIDLGRIGR